LTVPGIFLAAGEGKRFGGGKLLFPVDGEPLVVKSLRGPLESSLDQIIVVLGFQAELVRKAVRDSFGDNPKIRYSINPGYRTGMISSFTRGLSLLNGDEAGVMMLLGDMPFVQGKTINRLIRSWDGTAFVIPEVNGEMTHPRIIPKQLYEEFQQNGSGSSGKNILEKHRSMIKIVLFANNDEFMDIDRKNAVPGS